MAQHSILDATKLSALSTEGGGISIRDVGKLSELEYDTRELLVLNSLTLRSTFQPRYLPLKISRFGEISAEIEQNWKEIMIIKTFTGAQYRYSTVNGTLSSMIPHMIRRRR